MRSPRGLERLTGPWGASESALEKKRGCGEGKGMDTSGTSEADALVEGKSSGFDGFYPAT